jgi:hypothetical protein
MAFNGTEGEAITLQEASVLTENYRTNHPGAPLAHFIGKDLLEQILAQRDCMGIRVYYGEEDNGTPSLVFVGANDQENDQINGTIADKTIKCPPICSDPNALNS